jgi:hypothetical protein
MIAPTLAASIDRRILVNYRVDPHALAATLPPPFRPTLVGGYGVAGICIIRLHDVRPAGLPRAFSLRSENAAHRVAVEWDDDRGTHTGVYVPRRDTSSRAAVVLGGRAFPAELHLARFAVEEDGDRYRVRVASRDASVWIAVDVQRGATFESALFGDLDAASRFFRDAPIAYGSTSHAGVFDGVELGTAGWAIEPLRVERVVSSHFDDPRTFPAGSVSFDSAFLMRGLSTKWHPRPALRATA